MAKRISVDARWKLVRAIGERYREAARQDKLRILDEFVAVTGYHRKHSIRVLNDDSAVTATVRAPRLRLYDDAVREVLIVLWEAADRICGKRLKALVPVLLPALERHRHLQLDAAVREKVLAVSGPRVSWRRECRRQLRTHAGAHRHRERLDRVRRARRTRGLVASTRTTAASSSTRRCWPTARRRRSTSRVRERDPAKNAHPLPVRRLTRGLHSTTRATGNWARTSRDVIAATIAAGSATSTTTCV